MLLASTARAADAEAPAYGEELVVDAPTRLLGDWSGPDPVTVEVLDAQRLRASGARTLQDALQRVAGVHLSDEQGNPLQLDVSIRGLTASPVTGRPQGLSVFLDGVRLNEPAVEEVNLDLVPLADVERVEIVHGPHAVFGRNTLGGAIHVLTRRGAARTLVEAEVEGGSWAREATMARLGGRLGPLDGYLSVEQSSGGGWREQGSARALKSFGKVGLHHGDGDATLSYQFQRSVAQQPGSLPASMLGQDRAQNYTPGDFFEPRLHLVTLNARQRLAPGLSLAANAFLRALDAEQFNSSWLAADTRLFNATRSAGGIVQLALRTPLGPVRSQLTVGAEATRSSVGIVVREEPNARFAVTDEGLPLPRITSVVSDRQLALGAFVQERLRLEAGPLAGAAATAALRFDRISHDVVDASPDDPGKATGTAAFSRAVPAAGLRWELAPGWLASASWTGGFRAPAFLELTCADPAAPCIGLQAGVAPDTAFGSLRPVRSRTLEVGLSASPAEPVTVTVNVFRIDLRDDIFSVTAPGTTRVFFQNVGDTRRQGVELSLRVEAGPLQLDGSWAYTLGTFESDAAPATPRTGGVQSVSRGDELPLTPRHRADVGARLRALDWLHLSAGVEYVGEQYLLGDEENAEPRLPAYAVVRAGAEARWRRWRAFVRATNLLDARYEVFGTFSTNGRAAGEPVERFLMPGPPLRVLAGLGWELD